MTLTLPTLNTSDALAERRARFVHKYVMANTLVRDTRDCLQYLANKSTSTHNAYVKLHKQFCEIMHEMDGLMLTDENSLCSLLTAMEKLTQIVNNLNSLKANVQVQAGLI